MARRARALVTAVHRLRWMSVRPLLDHPLRSIAGPALLLVAVAGAAAVAARPHDAAAESVHVSGFHARVSGIRNWYGSYDMRELGMGWCIDPQVDHPPDPDLAYAPDGVAETDDDMRAAMAWAAGRNTDPDPVSAAAVTLVLHDLLARPYGGAPINVDHLDPGALDGFGGHEGAVVARARQIKADALGHAHLRAPFRLRLLVDPVAPGHPGELVASLSDANGVGVGGVPVLVGAAGATFSVDVLGVTGHDGVARFGFTAATGPNRFTGFAVLPDTTLAAFGPTRGPGQRVVVPRTVRAEGSAEFEAHPPPGEIEIDKRGDAEAYLPVDGAVFEVRPTGGDASTEPAARITTGAGGHGGPVQLPPGRYSVTESVAPAGYEVAPPQEVDVVSGARVTVTVDDRARRGRLSVAKEDGVTHDLVAGATFELRYDADRDGDAERTITELTTDEVATTVDGLVPGDYVLVETAPPPGYVALTEPVAVSVTPGETTEARVANQPRSTVELEKEPDPETTGGVDPDELPSLAGAVFAVRGPVPADDTGADAHGGADGRLVVPEPDISAVGPILPEVGRCTTDRAGRCRLPDDALVGGSRYCWEETAAPPGWGIAEPGCFTAGRAGTTVTVRVVEPLAPATPTTTPPTTSPPPPASPPGPPPDAPPGRPAAAPPRPSAPPPGAPSLPRTGTDALPTALAGLALTLCGAAATRWAASRGGGLTSG